jgi:eukaryotic-like serine/threonine-protein kinase
VSSSDGRISDLAGAILDGTPVDWASAESGVGDAERSLLDQLRMVAAVANVHRAFLLSPPALSLDQIEPPASHDAGVSGFDSWGHLRVLEKIGRGAFGEVFRAWDTRLDREVALKLLPGGSSKIGRRGTSIIQEGRMLARVRHPNVVTIYGAERIGDRIGLWMEFVRGHTLQQAFEQGTLVIPAEVVRVGIELCQAIRAVHGAGLLHRDIKPHNVMLAEDGRVVLMDLGAGHDLDDSSSAALAGTPLYLAPELLRGHVPTVRSDIYSLGVLLFYLLSGSYPVRAESLRELRLAHQRGERRDITDAWPDVPPQLARAIGRAVDPDPEHRYESAGHLAADLAAIVARPVRRASWVALWVASALMTVVGVLATTRLSGWRPNVARAGGLNRPLEPAPLTSLPGREVSPALSPDGNRVAFLWDGGDTGSAFFRLYVQPIGAEHPLQLTQGDGDAWQPTWSPDGRHLAFLRHPDPADGTLHHIVLVPATGGSERTVGTAIAGEHGLSWSPDGRYLAVVDKPSKKDPDAIHLLSIEDGGKQRLTSPPPHLNGDCCARFSPDGKSLAFFRVRTLSHADIYVFSLVDRTLRRVASDTSARGGGLDWTPDGRSVVFAAGPSPFMQRLWKVGATGGSPEDIGVIDGREPSTARRSRTAMAYVHFEFDSNVWRVPGPLASASDRTPVRIIDSTHLDLSPRLSPDGSRIAFVSRRSGTSELWTSDADGTNVARLTFLERDDLELDVDWSPDGRQLAFAAWVAGNHDLHLVSATGGVPERITSTPDDERMPRFSRDGRWIYFTSRRSGSDEIWKVSRAGGSPIQVTRQGGVEALESPDGRYLYYTKVRRYDEPQGIWRASLLDRKEEKILDHGIAQQWAVFDKGLCYVRATLRSRAAIECYDAASRSVQEIASLEQVPRVPGFTVSPDGRWILVTQVDRNESDLMMVEHLR